MAGTWDSNVRRQIFDLFDLTTGDDDVVKIEVHKSLRLTLEANRLQQNFAYAGWQAPTATEMLFCESPCKIRSDNELRWMDTCHPFQSPGCQIGAIGGLITN